MFGKRMDDISKQSVRPESSAPEFVSDLNRKSMPPTHESAKSRPSMISEGCEVEGSICFEGPMHLDGRFKGAMTVDSLTIGKTGDCEADLHCKKLVIRGRFSGKVTCEDLEVATGALIEADITYSRIHAAAESRILGSLRHQPSDG
jgi:cytoskeletal protein CcmA (bactofilin family)